MASTLALHQNREMIDPDKFCSLCHATFNDPVMAEQHYVGKKHRKQETKLKLMAHYGRLADPAVTDLSGERAQLIFRAGSGLDYWARSVLLLLMSSKAGFVNLDACGNQAGNLNESEAVIWLVEKCMPLLVITRLFSFSEDS